MTKASLLNRTCPIKGCTKPGSHVVQYSFKAKGYPEGSPRASLLFPFLVCEDHKDEVRVDHIITDTSWAHVEHIMKSMKVAAPDRASIKLHMIPIEHASPTTIENLVGLQAQQAIIDKPSGTLQ